MKTAFFIQLIFSIFYFQAKAQTVDFTYSTSNNLYCAPQTVTFTQNCTGSPTGFIWNFGNGQTGTNPVENITYSAAGTYTIKLTAIYPNSAITATKTLVISQTPSVSLSADKNYLCQPGSVVFTATGSGSITNYEWDFGDGSPLVTTAVNSVSHNYTGYNAYNAKVKVRTASGCTAIAGYDVNVSRFPVSGTVTPASGCIPINSLLSASAILPPGDATQSFTWNFGDGSPVSTTSANSINHLYNITTPVTTANVTITTVQGCTNQFTFAPFAYGTPAFGTAAGTVSTRDTFCGSETILFYGKATNANAYEWNFDDGTVTIINDTLIQHKFNTLGNKLVIVTPYFNGCAGLKDTVNIFIEGVIANYSMSNTCSAKNTFLFTNQSAGNISHFEWSFSDSPSMIDSNNYHVSHTFPVTGTYQAKLFLVDNITGCRDSLTRTLFTAAPVLTRSTSPVCKDSLVVYKVINSYPPGNGFTYEFHVNGFVVNNNEDSAINAFPPRLGDFNDYVVIKDNNNGTCDDSLFFSSATRVQGPVVDFSSTARLCADSGLTITNTSYPFFPGDQIITWNWDFGDTKTDSVRDPLPHVYPSAGIYSITLTATDVNGCAQKIERPVIVVATPLVNIFPARDTICQKDTAILTAFTADNVLWTPATNIDCTTCDTVKVYPNSTAMYIARAMNSDGCKAYDTAYVKVYEPGNLQVFPADTIICAGQTINYDLSITGNILWTPASFLSNNKIKNPVAKPDSAITYRIEVADSVGCFTDTAFARVRLFPAPSVNAGPDKILSYNASFTINPVYSNDVTGYTWTPAGSLNCNNCSDPTGLALAKETYRVEVQNIHGCKSSDSVTVFVNCIQANLLMPTAFTPNGDGNNDHFYPITRGYRMVKTFIIYNRLGIKVFERNNFLPNIPSLGWDGRIKGSGHGNTEVFTWFMEAECDLGRMNNSLGTVVLIR